MKNNPIFNDKAPNGKNEASATDSEDVIIDELEQNQAASETSELQARYDELRAELDAQKEDYMRRVAEFDNARKRLSKEKEELVKFANEKVLQDIFPVLDSLEMTLSHAKPETKDDPIVSGVQLILKQFLQVLQKHGLEEIGNVGETFDPNFHEAIGAVESPEHESGRIVQVHRKGYKLKDRLVRAALVTVSK